MDPQDAANKLSELGHLTRLEIFRRLVKAGPEGLPVGHIQKEFDIPGSTLSHHISRLVRADLIRQERESRTLYCIPEYDVLSELIDFLASECCADTGTCTSLKCGLERQETIQIRVGR